MKDVLSRAHAPEIQKILNREGFTSNRGLYKRVREETGDETSGNHNALSIKDALIEEGLVKMPEVPLEALVMSSILDKYGVKEINNEIINHLHECGFRKRTDKETTKDYYMRPWTGKIFSRYEEADEAHKEKALEKEKAAKREILSVEQVRERFKVMRIGKNHEATLKQEGFEKVLAEEAPHTVTYVREG